MRRVALRRSHVFFYDDNFGASQERLREIMEGIVSRGLRFSWSAQVCVDVARDEGLVRLMRRSGCRLVYAGIESANPLPAMAMVYARRLCRRMERMNSRFVEGLPGGR